MIAPGLILLLGSLTVSPYCYSDDNAEATDSIVPTPVALTSFEDSVRPLLVTYCGDCHSPDDEEDPVGFLKSMTTDEIQLRREIWSSAAEQLHNRTMPPADVAQPTEAERLQLSQWISHHLTATACDGDEFAGRPVPRRLNRDQYTHAINELTGLDFDFVETFPADGGGGEGFNNNGETLFMPPLLMERYLEVTSAVIDQAIVLKPRVSEFKTLAGAADARHSLLSSTAETFGLWIRLPPDAPEQTHVQVRVDGIVAGTLAPNDRRDGQHWMTVSLPKGQHVIAVRTSLADADATDANATGSNAPPIEQVRLLQLPRVEYRKGQQVERDRQKISEIVREFASQNAKTPIDQLQQNFSREFTQHGGDSLQKRLSATAKILGLSPDQDALTHALSREDAKTALSRFARKAWRRPIESSTIDRWMLLFDHVVKRGETPRAALQLALQAVLTSPHFLYISEADDDASGIHPISDLELATRLSFFLWYSLPDERLLKLAEQNELSVPQTLHEEVNRMLADPRSKRFADAFASQWLGTTAVGNTVIPDTSFFKPAYNDELVRDLREQVGQTMAWMIRENRPVTDWIDSNTVVVNHRLAKHYGMDQTAQKWNGDKNDFLPIETDNDPESSRRAGALGLGAVHMLTSYSRRTSPVLRGAWVLETIFGTRVPAPPPDVPSLPGGEKESGKTTVRERLEQHRENPTCAACHDLIDPIGFALENFDVIGRWRDRERGPESEAAWQEKAKKHPEKLKSLPEIDSSGRMPSGETFDGVDELRAVLMARQEAFLDEYIRRMLGFALARSLEEADACTIDSIRNRLLENDLQTRELIHAIIQSVPFQNRG
ncbi:putative signal peptide and transmembrane protein [Rhodopirellula islandica]|uniref:Signal peptide and transmembrane protein n=1 Tax=Rhodopirellula islandica TaxID=595434 RepID=A0A0J1B7H1_RHOIS|nr:DUF1592 domain-containing protein [Rhodopirellula islandica]KLU02785.1 putative signal peptide and transmembrane protein [Rhodopirellula islandica]